ncbi:type II toxin-antitoxin system VapC family toxin [Cellulomonas humilata]|uniref:Ribonuclease VapC n=1 Tax=Cellulomonas humilata TaxID=144055 RepID=A0ABU0ECK8_9CELL|nr:type II toxin-antitoxin system VapC family toxin [Cellulomonas humilata]MDQ0373003.1 putative nucleic acid-binding protein [Cellulomonas humilata]
MSFLLDTNVLSELRKPDADRRVVAWVDSRPSAELYVSAMTLYEIELGILARERRDPTQGAPLRAWFIGKVLPQFAERTLPVDGAVAVRAAGLSDPDRRPHTDGLIAATALVHSMAIVTRNVRDFAGIPGLAVANPWQQAPR